MVDWRISELPAAVSVATGDLLPVTQGSVGPATGVSRKATLEQLATLFGTQVNTLALQKAANLGDLADASAARTNLGLGSLALQSASSVAITGGSLNGAAIGGVTPAAGAFTTLAASGAVSGAGVNALFAAPPALGGTTPSTATIARLRIAASGTPTALPRMVEVVQASGQSGAGVNTFRVGGNHFGALTSTLLGVWQFVMDSDTMTVSSPSTMGVVGMDVAAAMKAGWSGGRTLHWVRLNVNEAAGAQSENYLVAGAAFAEGRASAGGTASQRAGSLFGNNFSSRLHTGAGRYYRAVVGSEVNAGLYADTQALDNIGEQAVIWTNSVNRGLRADVAYKIGMQKDGTAPGWRHFFQLGGEDGWWPGTATSSIMRTGVVTTGGPAMLLGAGFDLAEITFSGPILRASGVQLAAGGDFGATSAGGKVVKTRSEVKAVSGGVASVAVLDGGLFEAAAPLTLTCSAPPDSGTTAVLALATSALVAIYNVVNPGVNYQVGDTFLVNGGTFSVQGIGTVDKVGPGGELEGAFISTGGNYSVLPGAGATTTTLTGVGVGATVTLWATALTVGVTTPGTNYGPNLPPAVTQGGTVLRRALLALTMSETQGTLLLNDGAKTSVGGHLLHKGQALTATGTTQGTAAAITGDIVFGTAAAGQTGVRLPVGEAGMRITVWRAAASTANLLVYPATGEQISLGGALGANTPATLTADGAIFECVTAGLWAGVVIG